YGYTIPADLIVDFYYPDASPQDRSTLIDSLNNGAIDHYDFLHGWTAVSPYVERPSADTVLYAIHAAGHGEPVLPEIDLDLHGLGEPNLDFLVGMYVSAFGRAPEHEGLAYWAGQLADDLNQGWPPDDARKAVASLMYASGAANGEAQAHLDDAAYVNHLYASMLNREPDARGAAYWTKHLREGGERSEFIAVMLASALESTGDDAYLAARITVAKYVAQEAISGDTEAMDLAAVLAGVYNGATAWRAIVDLDAALLQRVADPFDWEGPGADFTPPGDPSFETYVAELIAASPRQAANDFDGGF